MCPNICENQELLISNYINHSTFPMLFGKLAALHYFAILGYKDNSKEPINQYRPLYSDDCVVVFSTPSGELSFVIGTLIGLYIHYLFC